MAVVGHPQGGGPVEAGQVVEFPHHQAVGDDHPGGQLVAAEQAQGVAGHDHQGLLVGEGLEVLFQQPVLHPVLAHLAGFPVGHQLVGVKSHVEVQVIVDHHLEGLALDAVARIFADGFAVNFPRRAEPVAVDPAVLRQFLGKFPGHDLVVGLGDVPQGVGNGQRPVGGGELGFPPRRPANPRDKFGVIR